MWIRLRLGHLLFQIVDLFLEARQIAQYIGLADLQVDVLREQLQQLFDHGEFTQRILIVAGQTALGHQGAAMVRLLLLHVLKALQRKLALMLVQRFLHLIIGIVEFTVGERQTIKQMGLIRRHQRQTAGARRAIVFTGLFDEKFLDRRVIRIAHQIKPQPLVVTHYRLQMGRTGFHRGKREGYTAINQGERNVRFQTEFAHVPTLLHGPAPFRVIGRAVVTDRLNDIQMISTLLPVTKQRTQGGGRTGHVMLTDEGNVQQYFLFAGIGTLQVFPHYLVKARADSFQRFGGAGQIPFRHRLLEIGNRQVLFQIPGIGHK